VNIGRYCHKLNQIKFLAFRVLKPVRFKGLRGDIRFMICYYVKLLYRMTFIIKSAITEINV